MNRYRLGKTQIQRLISGTFVIDGHGRKYIASEKIRSRLETVFCDKDAYSKFDVFMREGCIEIIEKPGSAK